MSWRRSARWLAFFATLALLGFGIHRAQPPEPFWSVLSARVERYGKGNGWLYPRPVHFSRDGKLLFLVIDDRYDLVKGADLDSEGSLQIVDAVTGETRSRHPQKGQRISDYIFSEDRRFFAAGFSRDAQTDKHEQFICVVNLQASKDLYVSLPHLEFGFDTRTHLEFSSDGQFLAYSWSDGNFRNGVLRVYDTDSGDLLLTRNTRCFPSGPAFCGEMLVHRLRTNGDDDGSTELWSTRERKTLDDLPITGQPFDVSPDGRFLATRSRHEQDKIEIWNIQTRQRQADFRSELTQFSSHMTSSDGKWLLIQGKRGDEKKSWLERREFANGKLVCVAAATGYSMRVLSPDNRLIVTYEPVSSPILPPLPSRSGINVLDVETLKPLWDHPNAETHGLVLFSNDSKRLIVRTNDGDAIDILDSLNGELLHSVPLCYGQTQNRADFTAISQTPDGRTLLVTQPDNPNAPAQETLWVRMLKKMGIDSRRFGRRYNDVTIVYDLSSLRERFRLEDCNAANAVLSDDGNFVAILHDDENGSYLRCWDVNNHKPLRWSLGIPAGLGMLFLLLCKVRRRWAGLAGRRTSAPTPPVAVQ
jgi:WD40 repeat protein